MLLHNVSNKEVRVCWCVSPSVPEVCPLCPLWPSINRKRVFMLEKILMTPRRARSSQQRTHTGHYSGNRHNMSRQRCILPVDIYIYTL